MTIFLLSFGGDLDLLQKRCESKNKVILLFWHSLRFTVRWYAWNPVNGEIERANIFLSLANWDRRVNVEHRLPLGWPGGEAGAQQGVVVVDICPFYFWGCGKGQKERIRRNRSVLWLSIFGPWCREWVESDKLKGEGLSLLTVGDSGRDSWVEALRQDRWTSIAKKAVVRDHEESSSHLDTSPILALGWEPAGLSSWLPLEGAVIHSRTEGRATDYETNGGPGGESCL